MLKIDLHIHSIHSGHAYGTFYDILNEAARKKMKMIAITDHGPGLIGGTSIINFKMGGRAPKTYKGVRILWGCELNPINAQGDLDLDERHQKQLDLVLVNFHRHAGYEDLGKKKNTEVIKKILKNPLIKILSHPTHPQFEYDFEEVWNFAMDCGVMLELNLSYLVKKENDLDLFKRMVAAVKARGKKLIVNSDAHFLHEIGDDSVLKKKWKELGLSKELIINNYPEELMKFLRIK